jgi:hypothetical protein
MTKKPKDFSFSGNPSKGVKKLGAVERTEGHLQIGSKAKKEKGIETAPKNLFLRKTSIDWHQSYRCA